VRDPQAEPADLIRSVSRALRVLESVGATPRGLTVKQIARRCELTVATTYHLVRTLAYEGYVVRRDDGTYGVGLEISDASESPLTSGYTAPTATSGSVSNSSNANTRTASGPIGSGRCANQPASAGCAGDQASLRPLPTGPARQALEAVCDLIADRTA